MLNDQTSFRIKSLALVAIISSSLLNTSSCGLYTSSQNSRLNDLGDSVQTAARISLIFDKIEAIKSTVMINDEARLQVLNRSVAATLELVKTKGIGHMKTGNSLRKLVMYFIYSEQFFEFIRTDRNQADIAFVLRDTIATDRDSIRVDIGYDEDPLGTILADNLDIIQQRLNELLAAPELPQNVRSGLTPLIARVGYVYGLARGTGDRPIPYDEGTILCGEIDEIYPFLDELVGSQQFFQSSQDIRGTNEFLKDFLQVNQRRP